MGGEMGGDGRHRPGGEQREARGPRIVPQYRSIGAATPMLSPPRSRLSSPFGWPGSRWTG